MKEFKVFRCYEYKDSCEILEKMLNDGWIIHRADRVTRFALLYILEKVR